MAIGIKCCLENSIPVYLAGPAGSGKNFTVEQIAKELEWAKLKYKGKGEN